MPTGPQVSDQITWGALSLLLPHQHRHYLNNFISWVCCQFPQSRSKLFLTFYSGHHFSSFKHRHRLNVKSSWFSHILFVLKMRTSHTHLSLLADLLLPTKLWNLCQPVGDWGYGQLTQIARDVDIMSMSGAFSNFFFYCPCCPLRTAWTLL